jgi:hypothetical protein
LSNRNRPAPEAELVASGLAAARKAASDSGPAESPPPKLSFEICRTSCPLAKSAMVSMASLGKVKTKVSAPAPRYALQARYRAVSRAQQI